MKKIKGTARKKSSQKKNRKAKVKSGSKVDATHSAIPEKVAKTKPKPIKIARTKSPSKITEWYTIVRDFLQESKIELKKVTWPTRKETMATTSVVLVVVLFIAAFLGIVDLALGKVIGYLLR